MSTYDAHKVLSVACPKCGEGPGDRCRSSSGRQLYDPHTLRKAAVYPSYLKNASGDTRGKPKLEDGDG